MQNLKTKQLTLVSFWENIEMCIDKLKTQLSHIDSTKFMN